MSKFRLFKSDEYPQHWIGTDELGGIVYWPKAPKGWSRRTPYNGSKRGLEEVDPALARGTGWPGGGRGPAPRDPSGAATDQVGLRVTHGEREKWEQAATVRQQSLTGWARGELNEAADRVLEGERKGKRKTGG
jgi:hypothetical protein